MPATVVIIVKLMPESLEVSLEEVKKKAQDLLVPEGAKNLSFEEVPIAFGLKALKVKMDMPEEKGTDLVENRLATIPGISSVTIEDYRRAFG
ncbi:elongation factor 1-beta [Candidatus Pacearchaeota archaeon]|nr:elongation factor 1-beta [Candidatus Pacearchaeota archaeon]